MGLSSGVVATIDPTTGVINIQSGTSQITMNGLLEADYEYKFENNLMVAGLHPTDNSHWFRLVRDGSVTSTPGYQTAGYWSQYSSTWGVYASNAGIGGAIGMVSGQSGQPNSYNPYKNIFTLTPNKNVDTSYWFSFESMTQGSARSAQGRGYTPKEPSTPTRQWNGVNYFIGGSGFFYGEIQIFRRKLR